MRLLLYALLLLPALAFTAPPSKLLQSEKNTIRVFNTSVKSVVNVTSKRVVRSSMGWFHFDTREIPVGTGTGFVWDNRGHIVTNYHVVAKGGSFMISFHKDQKQYEAKVIGSVPEKDIAVLKLIEKPPRLNPISVGSSHPLQVGQKALAIGNPFGLRPHHNPRNHFGIGSQNQRYRRCGNTPDDPDRLLY